MRRSRIIYTLLTIISGINYFVKNWQVFKAPETKNDNNTQENVTEVNNEENTKEGK